MPEAPHWLLRGFRAEAKKRCAFDKLSEVIGARACHIGIMKTKARPSKPRIRSLEKIPRKWATHFRALGRLRERILQERTEHRVAAAEPEKGHAADWVEAASEKAEREIVAAELGEEERELGEIEAALERIRRGTYGVCEATGKPIPAARLRALPWTRYTLEAAAAKERRR